MNTITLDIECDGLDFMQPKLVGFAVYSPNNPQMLPNGYYSNIPQDLELLNIFMDSRYLKICHNLKFEYNYLKSLGITMSPPYYCTQVASQLAGLFYDKKVGDKVNRYYGLKGLAEKYLGYTDLKTFKDLAKEYGKPKGYRKDGTPTKSKIPAVASEIPSEILGEYCKKDVEMTYKLYQKTFPIITKNANLKKYFMLEMKLIPIYAEMERNGILLDTEYLKQYSDELIETRERLEEQMNDTVKTKTTKEEVRARKEETTKGEGV